MIGSDLDCFIYLQKWFSNEQKFTVKKDQLGRSNANIFFIEHGTQKKYVLKCAPIGAANSLRAEFNNLIWLENKIPVPRVSWHKIENGWEWLLMQYVEGTLASNWSKKQPKKIGSILGETLKAIHNIPKEQFLTERGSHISTLPAKKLKNPPFEPDLVFSHGDYCLPNILIKNGIVQAIIDLGDAGVYDRYHDIYWCIWSLRYNQLADSIPYFLEAYGITSLDKNKMKYMETIHT